MLRDSAARACAVIAFLLVPSLSPGAQSLDPDCATDSFRTFTQLDLTPQRLEAQQEISKSPVANEDYNAAIRARFAAIRRHLVSHQRVSQKLVSQAHNLAIADIHINGRPKFEIAAFSGTSEIPGTAPPVDPSQTHFRPTNSRMNDSEHKLLEQLARQLNPGDSGVIHLFSERLPCPSCSLVIQDFKKQFPLIRIVVPRLSSWSVSN